MSADREHSGAAPWILLGPFLLIFGVFTLYPLARSVTLSLQQTFGPEATAWVGLANFRVLLTDPLFHKSVVNTLVFTAGSVFIQLPVALGLALLLNRRGLPGRGVLRLAFFAPQLVGMAFVAMLGRVVFEKNTGLLNRALHQLVGFDLEFAWLEQHVMWTLILTALWMYAGFNMIFFLAALQNVDPELEEAAKIDGADALRRFFVVTLPAIRPVAGFVVLLSIIGSLQLFELPFLMLIGGGADNRGLTIVTYLYQTAFEEGNLGYASAIGWGLAMLLAAFAMGYVLLLGREAS